MTKNDQNGKFVKPEEVDLGRLFRVINRRKWILISSVSIMLILAILYNTFSKPTYESKALLKKEKQQKSTSTDKLTEIISLQSANEIETELELVKTTEVLNKTINELSLFATIQRIENPKTIEINKQYLEYQKYFIDKNQGVSYPQFLNITMLSMVSSYEGYIQKKNGEFRFYELPSGDMLTSAKATQDTANFNLPDLNFKFVWKDAVEGGKIFFKFDDINDTRKKLNSNIVVEQKAKTDVFEIGVRASTPFIAKEIAKSITENFRAERINQQKQTIRYSFDFVDQNLEDIKKKLEDAEKSLTEYKSAHQIMDIEGSSQDLIRFLSSLEAEKLNNELQLTDYKNKYDQMSGELSKNGFFDQTFLSPSPGGNEPTNSPFSALMRQQSDLELQRLDLLEKRKETHPDVINIDNQLKQVRNKLQSYNENTLTSYNIIIKSLQQKENRLNEMMGKYESKMQSLPAQENQLATLLRQQNVYTKMYTLLLDKREEMRMAELSKLQDIVVVDEPTEPMEPVLPRKTFNLAGGLILGLFFGFLALFFVEFKNKKLVSLDDIENDFKLPIYAIIPNFNKELSKKIQSAKKMEDRFVTLMNEQDGYKESFRVLRTKLSSNFENKSKIILFTSSEENTGKTSIVSNLGISFALSRKKVLLVDCDLKKAALSTLFDITEDAPGLISYLKRKVPQPYIYNKLLNTLDILPAGGISENSGDLLGTDRMKNLFNMINTSQYDYILIDTPPVTRVVDTLVIGKVVKDVVLVIRPDHTFKDSVTWGIQEMEHENMKIHGTVINAGNIEKSSFKYRYGYGYGYGYGKYKLEVKSTA